MTETAPEGTAPADRSDNPERILAEIAEAAKRRQRARKRIDQETAAMRDLIPHARAAGATVDAIAQTIGITRQAVYDLLKSGHGRSNSEEGTKR